MKKVLILLIFCFSFSISNAGTTAQSDCTDVAFDETDAWLDAGISPEVAGCFGRAAYALCEGYSWDEIDRCY